MQSVEAIHCDGDCQQIDIIQRRISAIGLSSATHGRQVTESISVDLLKDHIDAINR